MISLKLYVQKSFLDKRRCLNVEKFKFLKKKLLSVLFLKFHGSREINIAVPPVFYYMLILIILIFVLFFNLFTGVLGSLFLFKGFSSVFLSCAGVCCSVTVLT